MSKVLWFLGGCAAGVFAAAAAQVLSENSAFSSSLRDESSVVDDKDDAPITVADAADAGHEAAEAPAALIV